MKARAVTCGALIAALAACSTAGGRDPLQAPTVTNQVGGPGTAGPPQRVVVAIVIDQLAMWTAIERFDKLPATGGFAKLRAEASAIAELHLGHASTSSAAGHAALYTGGSPRDTGILGDEVLTPSGALLATLTDDKTVVLAATGKQERAGASLASLAVPTLADALRAEQPHGLIVSVATTDVASLLGAGRGPDAALWFDADVDALVSSTAYASELPAWARSFTTPGAGAGYRERPWVPHDPAWLAALTDLPAPDLGQGDFMGLGPRFPHDTARAKKPPAAFAATPFADTFVIDAAIAAVDEAAARRRPTLLAIGLGASDTIGHVFGPDAPEAWDHMLRLDADLRRLLVRLDEKLGPAGYGVVLAANHGGSSTPEVMNQGFCDRPDADRFERRCDRARRLVGKEIVKIAEEAARRAAGEGDWVLGLAEPFLVLRPAARALPKDKLDALISGVTRAMSSTPGIARAVDVRTAPATCPPPGDESLDALVCRSILGTRGGDVMLVPKPGAFFDGKLVPGDGVSHGSPYLYDRAVPMFVRPPRPASAPPSGAPVSLSGRAVVDQRAFAVTLASLLGVAPPALAAGGADISSPMVR